MRSRAGRLTGTIALALALAACGGRIVPPGTVADTAEPVRPSSRPPARPVHYLARPDQPQNVRPSDGRIVAATPIAAQTVYPVAGATTAATAGLVAGPPIASLPITPAQAEAARIAFARSCPGLMRRTDTSGLTRGADWRPACAAASAGSDARAFFAQYLEAVQVGDGRAFATGYYEPEIRGSLERRPGYEVPVYGRPTDLIDVDLGRFSDDLKGKKVRGRVDGSNLVPYFDRTQIEEGALARTAPVIAWAADPVEMFFLQIQGSGRLRLPDGGGVLRIGYDTQNGRAYTGIGSLMRQRGLLAPGQASMQGIVAWLRANPDQGRALMRENKSFVFFRELDGPPQGAMGYAVTGQVSAAADPKFVPLGAPVFLSLDRADASGLWVAQDTGGAIKGANRFDTFWGAGPNAELTAGGMSGRGTAFLLLPAGTLARLNPGAGLAPPQP
ncbi:membrane-bound lytic murein transglycosylase A [Sphingomonas rubra]|uniref:peptidoglycan lytic exotransglycosylase n=1 Tax=Sphingomonas rubra TaxID=634430 RepID=A0A1I5QXJ9_9SPHN|nr:membrane-bound lytic murein transglycosylase A [Sphingomonas rubra]